MPQGTNPARESLARALASTTIHRRLLLPEDLADHLLNPEDEVLLSLPGIPGDTPEILLVTRQEVILGRWDAAGSAPKDITRKRAVPARDVRGASYTPGMYYKVEIAVDSARDLRIEPCTVEDALRFTHGLQSLVATGQVPAPMAPADVVAARHAHGEYSPDSTENRMRAAWDRALLGGTGLWNSEAAHSGPALGWLLPGEHTLLVLIGATGMNTDFLAVTDRRVLRGRAPGDHTDAHAAQDVREAVYDEGFFQDTVRIEMHDGSTLKLAGGFDLIEGREFVDALNTLIATGSLPSELLPFR